jgi:hypothetical protein
LAHCSLDAVEFAQDAGGVGFNDPAGGGSGGYAMPKYMILYRSSMSMGEQMGTPEEAQASMEAWMTWAGNAGSRLVDMGSPLAPVGAEGPGGETGVAIGGYSVLEAESLQAARSLIDGHPHLSAPGGSFIEILEFLPPPGG